MGLKASYEAIVFWRDFSASDEIRRFQKEIPFLCTSLEQELGTVLRFEDSRIQLSVANLIYTGGEARTATPALAFNLPNDEKVIEEIGSRQVILKNVVEAKFHSVAWPILINVMQEPKIDKERAFTEFYNHTLFHEISHSIGPQRIVKHGEFTTVNKSLKQYYSVLEEAKADTLAACFMLEGFQRGNSQAFYESYVSGFLRAIRFGLKSAHGGANCIQLNFLLKEQAISISAAKGKIEINGSHMRQAIFKLTSEIIRIQERGDLEAARILSDTYCVITPAIKRLVQEVSNLPVDIRIRYKTKP
jgi:hypothetical protein